LKVVDTPGIAAENHTRLLIDIFSAVKKLLFLIENYAYAITLPVVNFSSKEMQCVYSAPFNIVQNYKITVINFFIVVSFSSSNFFSPTYVLTWIVVVVKQWY